MGMLNIDCHGNVSSFSPELLGYKNRAYNDFIIGNVLSDSLEEMRRSTAMQAMTRGHRRRRRNVPQRMRLLLRVRRRRPR